MSIRKSRYLLPLLAVIAALFLASCQKESFFPSGGDQTENGGSGNDSGSGENGNAGNGESGGGQEGQDGGTGGGTIDMGYVWDMTTVPEIHIEVALDQWNALLASYDRDKMTREYIHCNVEYIKEGEYSRIEDAGLRLRGNTSRRRPEKGNGPHVKDKAGWQHCHYGLNFRKFVKDEAHTVRGIHKVNLKYFKDDPMYVREVFCYDLFRRFGVWTAVQDTYCRVWLHVSGDRNPVYLGVYEMLEPVNDEYLEYRTDQFGTSTGNLWKCAWGADLHRTDANLFGADDNVHNYAYEWKCGSAGFQSGKEQLEDFILKLRGKGEDSFYKWIQEVCDVELLLKTYAVNVAVGMWDDYWNNTNNYYLYFNSTDKYAYRFYFIPFDYDNTLGTSSDSGSQSDSGRQDPMHWGSDSNPLIARLLRFPDFRKIYQDALRELVDPASGYMDQESAAARIRSWQRMIREQVANDTGENMTVEDRPASWGNHSEYRLLDPGTDNFFKVKAASIHSMQ